MTGVGDTFGKCIKRPGGKPLAWGEGHFGFELSANLARPAVTGQIAVQPNGRDR